MDGATWEDAKEFCANHESYLLEFDSEEEVNFVANIMADNFEGKSI